MERDCSNPSLEPRESPKEIQKVSHPFGNNDDSDGKTPEKVPLLISLHSFEDFKAQMTGCLEMLQSSVLNIFKQVIFVLHLAAAD